MAKARKCGYNNRTFLSALLEQSYLLQYYRAHYEYQNSFGR